MPPSTKIRRGVGLLLLAVLAWFAGGLLASGSDRFIGAADALAWIGLIVAALLLLAGFVSALAGLVLLLWGLLRG